MLAGNNNEAQAFLTRGAQVIIRMRGLPYDCTAKQVVSSLIQTDLVNWEHNTHLLTVLVILFTVYFLFLIR